MLGYLSQYGQLPVNDTRATDGQVALRPASEPTCPAARDYGRGQRH